MRPRKTLFEIHKDGYIGTINDLVPRDRPKLKACWIEAFQNAPIYHISENLVEALKSIPTDNFNTIINKIGDFKGYLVFKNFTFEGKRFKSEGILIDITNGDINLGIICKDTTEFMGIMDNRRGPQENVNRLVESSFPYIAHLIYYIQSGQEEYSIKKKNYYGKPKIPPKRFISIRENYIVGRNFVIAINGEEFGVRGHYRWQPCGKNNQDRKLIFIKPFKKRLTKHIKEVGQAS